MTESTLMTTAVDCICIHLHCTAPHVIPLCSLTSMVVCYLHGPYTVDSKSDCNKYILWPDATHQSGTSCIGYRSDNGSSSRRVFSWTTACTIYHPAICPACVSRSLSQPQPPIRSAARSDLVVPATKTVCYGPRSFAVAGPATWNLLPASLRDDQHSVATFRRLLKTELFSRAYDSSLAVVTVVNCKSGRT